MGRLLLWCGGGGGCCFDGSGDCFLLFLLRAIALALPFFLGRCIAIVPIVVKLRQRVGNVLELHDGTLVAEVERVHLHGADEARERHLLELVVDEVADGVGEGEAGGTGRQAGPVDGDGHLPFVSSYMVSDVCVCVFWGIRVGGRSRGMGSGLISEVEVVISGT